MKTFIQALKNFKKLFGSKKQAVIDSETTLKSKYDGFDVEYLPHAGRYFPRFKGKYLLWWTTKQNFTLQDNISACEYGNNLEEAMNIIDRFLELRGVGSNIINLQ